MRRCSPGASTSSGYLHNELHRRLVDSSSVASVGSSASRCSSCPHEKVGVTTKCQKSVLSLLQRTTFLGEAWDSTSMQPRLSPAHIDSILSAVKRIRLGQSLTVKQFQRLLGLMAAASNVIPFGLLYFGGPQYRSRHPVETGADRSAPSPGESSPGPGSTTSHCPAVAGRVWFPDIISLLDEPPLELPVRRDLLSQAGGSIFHPQPELWAWPLRGPSS